MIIKTAAAPAAAVFVIYEECQFAQYIIVIFPENPGMSGIII